MNETPAGVTPVRPPTRRPAPTARAATLATGNVTGIVDPADRAAVRGYRPTHRQMNDATAPTADSAGARSFYGADPGDSANVMMVSVAITVTYCRPFTA